MIDLKDKDKLRVEIEGAESIAIFGHRNIDGDAIGSCLGLGTVCENLGKEVSYFTPDIPGSSFEFLDGIKKFKTNFDFHPHYDLLIFCDTANPNQLLTDFRVGHEAYFDKMNKIVIDHHWSNTKFGDINIVDDKASSACEMVTEIIRYLSGKIGIELMTPEIANYLFLGLSTDSGHFIYEQDSVRTFSAAIYLLESGADKKTIIDKLYRSKTLKGLKFQGILTDRLTKHDGVLWTYYRKEELAKTGLDKEEADSFLSQMNSLNHDGITALIKIHDHEKPGFLKCSLRSKGGVNVGEVAEKFNGGGHKAAAGCKVVFQDDRETGLESFIYELKNCTQIN